MQSIGLILLLAAAPQPEFNNIDHETFLGQFRMQDGILEGRVETVVDAKKQKVLDVLTDWKNVRHLLNESKVWKVKRSTETTATIYREIDPPIPFMDDQWLVYDIKRLDKEDAVRITWTRTKGSIERFVGVWTVRSVAAGTYVSWELEVKTPFSPPDFILARLQSSRAAEMVEQLRKRSGGKHARPPARK